MFAIWPFDWSLDGFLFVIVVFILWTSWCVGNAAKKAADAAKKLAENETAQEVGKGVLQAWLESLMNKR
jgi:cbb3-type cytochrome oxidase subunit 3